MTSEEKLLGGSFNNSFHNLPQNDRDNISIFFFLCKLAFIAILFVLTYSYQITKIWARERMGKNHISEVTRGLLVVVPLCFALYLFFNADALSLYYREVEHFNKLRIILSGIIYLFICSFILDKCNRLILDSNNRNLRIDENYPGDYEPVRVGDKTKDINPAWSIFFFDPIALFLTGGLLGAIHPINIPPFVIMTFAYYPVVIFKCLFGLTGYNLNYFIKSKQPKKFDNFDNVQ